MIEQTFPLHPAQRDVFVDQLINIDSPHYNIGGYIKFIGNIDKPKFFKVVQEAPLVFDAFKMRFDIDNLNPIGYFDKDYEKMEVQELDFSLQNDPESLAEKWMQDRFNTPFKLQKDELLFEHVLIRISENEHWFFHRYHHLITDGYGFAIWVNYFGQKYKSLITGEPFNFQSYSYYEEAVTSSKYSESEFYENDRNYWIERVGEKPAKLLYKNYSEGKETKKASSNFTLNIEDSIKQKIESFSERSGAGIQQLVIAATLIYLGKITGQKDFLFGIPVHRRNSRKLRGIVGLFSGIIPYKGEYKPEILLSEFLVNIANNQKRDYRHRNYPIGDLSRHYKINPSEGYLTEFSINYESLNFELDFGKDLKAFIIRMLNEFEKNPIEICWRDYGGEHPSQLDIHYLKEYFSKDEVELLAKRILNILEQFSYNYDRPVSQIEILTDMDKTMLNSFNSTDMDLEISGTLLDLFEAEVIKDPDRKILEFTNSIFTYAELDELSSKAANMFRQQGIGNGTLVPILMERSPELILSILGILKAGGCYIPIETSFPSERIRFMLDDCRAQFLVTQPHLSSSILNHKHITRIIISDYLDFEDYQSTKLKRIQKQSDTACVIYTSGSTGKPKGVLLKHLGIMNRILWMKNTYPPLNGEKWVMKTSIGFVDHIWELFGPLCLGVPSIFLNKAETLDLKLFLEKLEEHKITRIVLVPSLLRVVLNALKTAKIDLSNLKYWTSSGENLTTDLVSSFYKNFDAGNHHLLNIYGSTEISADATWFDASEIWEKKLQSDQFPNKIPIGKPIANTKILMLTRAGEICPLGVAGEIYIGGKGLSDGYLYNRELNAQKFVKITTPEGLSEIMYRTGDLGRWLIDGNIEYIARMDRQVKIRGHRIELLEIEETLLNLKLFKEVAVSSIPDKEHGNILVGYVVPKLAFDKYTIVQQLRDIIPDYMIPSVWVELKTLPLNSSGKISYIDLPNPEIEETRVSDYIPPRDELEQRISDIWQELLHNDRIGIFQNFLELGGHSILAMRVIYAIRSQLDVEIGVKDLFTHPTIAELSQFIKFQNKGALNSSLSVQPKPEYIPLSFSQERLWFIDKLEGSVQYHIYAVLRLKGTLNKEALEDSFRKIINRHEALRTIILENNGEPYQIIKEHESWKLEFSAPAGISGEKDLRKYIRIIINAPFNLSKDYMIKGHLIELTNDEHILLVVLHHIAADGWSATVIVRELAELYNAYQIKDDPELPILKVQYSDYAIWQRKYMQGKILDDKLSYWSNKLKGVEALNMPTDFARPAIQSINGSTLEFNIENEIKEQLLGISQQQNLTLYMTMLAAFKVMLHQYSGQEDICVGTPIAGRQQHEVEDLVGFFANTLALRTDLSGNPSFVSLLERIRATVLEAYENQEVSFEKVVEAVVNERDLSRSPLFQIMFVWNETKALQKLYLGDLSLSQEPFTGNTSQFDISFSLTETIDGLHGQVEYCTDLYTEHTIRSMIVHYKELLVSIITKPNFGISELSMFTREESNQILKVFNDTDSGYRTDKSLIQLFEEQAAKTPYSISLTFGSESFSFNEINQQANQLARYLSNIGLKSGSLIPICLERGSSLVTTILGILKTGAAYIPIDPDFPKDRISYMLRDCKAKLIICSQNTRSKIESLKDLLIIDLDKEGKKIDQEDVDDLEVEVLPNQVAHVIYTSGSTGKPKGVMTEHRSLVNLLNSVAKKVNFTSSSGFLSFTTYSFDIFYLELYLPLIKGGKLYLASKEITTDGFLLKNAIEEHKPTHLQGTPASWSLLLNANWQNPEKATMLVGGETVKDHLNDELTKRGRVFNLYGPTESTIYSTGTELQYGKKVLIGKPLDNTKIYILNPVLHPVPVGVPGEIYIGGHGLSRGYLNRKELTDQKFIHNPFSQEFGSKLYRTGDLGKWLHDGNIEFLRRLDDQVKIRGFRIELGEIESVIQKSNLIHHSVILVKDDRGGNKILVGYVVGKKNYSKKKLVQYLKSQLPEYMIPLLWVNLDELPLTPNGKIDRKALPNPEENSRSDEYIAPRSAIENKIAVIWEDLLNGDPIGIHDNFFELGGHSLLAMRVIAACRKEFNVEIGVKDLFINPTINEFGAFINYLKKGLELPAITVDARRPEHIPLSYSQERLWFIDKLEGSIQYHMSAVLRIKGSLKPDILEKAIQFVVQKHEVLRTNLYEEEGVGYQKVIQNQRFKLILNKDFLKNRSKKDRLLFIEDLINKPFDLSSDLKLRACLLHLEEDLYNLVLVMHHIASDGWSLNILTTEIENSYNDLLHHKKVKKEDLSVQYADYAIWQRKVFNEEVLNKKLKYWKKKLKDLEPLQLPIDFTRPAQQSTRGASFDFVIKKDVLDKLNKVAQERNSTLFMLLLSGYFVLLNKYSGQVDICVGTPHAGRNYQEIEDLIGFFVNTIALRNTVGVSDSFDELIESVKKSTLEAFDHQEVPFEMVVESVIKERDLSRNPIFQTMFGMEENPDLNNLNLEKLEVTHEKIDNTTSQFDVLVSIAKAGADLKGHVQYCSDLFLPETIERMMLHYVQILKALGNNPNQQIDSFDLITETERKTILEKFNETIRVKPVNDTVVSVFSKMVAEYGNSVALKYQEQSVTYKDLDSRSSMLAHHLHANGLESRMFVPVIMDRGIETIISLMAILKAGCVYVPIDSTYPDERIKFILSDTGAEYLITQNEIAKRLPADLKIKIIDYKDAFSKKQAYSKSNPIGMVSPEQLAYVIYTSGSTGIPKGVMIEHKSVVNLCEGQKVLLGLKPGTRSLQFASYGFDASCYEIFNALLSGGCLVIASLEEVKDAFKFTELVNSSKVELATLPPSFINGIKDQDIHLSTIVSAGEPLHIKLAKEITSKGIQLINAYGPTESTVCATLAVQTDGQKKVSIGKPVPNTKIYVLNNDGKLQPIGVPGEIFIGGPQVARGYLNRSSLTEECFVQDIFSKEKGARMYKTGDIAKWDPDGNLEYLRRADDQLKIRGYRIEPGEIEAIIEQTKSVEQAFVTSSSEGDGNKKLVAYILRSENFDKEELSKYLESRLPEYMIPNIWVELEFFPLTSSGKVDKKALPKPNLTGAADSTEIDSLTDEEAKLIEIWKDLLEVENLGLHDNFFDLGGDSILTIQLVSRARKENIHFEVADLFAHQTIYELLKFINGIKEIKEEYTTEQGILSGEVGLLPIQQWYLSQDQPEVSHYNQSVLLRIDKAIGLSQLEAVLEKLVYQHDALSMVFSNKQGKWEQRYGKGRYGVEEEDLRGSDHWQEEWLVKAEPYQRSLDIRKGDLLRCVLVQTPEKEQDNRLLLIVHHLVIDGVSWRIVLEQMEGLLSGRLQDLGSKSSSVRQWYDWLEVYGKTTGAQQELQHWVGVKGGYEGGLITDRKQEGPIEVKDMSYEEVRLSKVQTKQLLQEVSVVYHTEIDDLLLCALAQTLMRWQNRSRITIGLEGHGRQMQGTSVDTTGTVGWFTSLYPVSIEAEEGEDVGGWIKSVKEQLRRVPNKGLGYGIHKYINKAEALQGEDPWEVVFNYLGQLDRVVEGKILKAAGEDTGGSVSGLHRVREKLMLNGLVESGHLKIRWDYSPELIDRKTVEKWSKEYMKVLSEMITHLMDCRLRQEHYNTPSDYGLGPYLNYRQLDTFLSEPYGSGSLGSSIESVYRLSGLQEGMLFHSLYNEHTGAYIEQFRADLYELDKKSFMESWSMLIKRHSILRSGFYHEGLPLAVQVVHREVEMPLEELDYSRYGSKEQQGMLEAYVSADRRKGFDLSSSPLMRLSLLKLSSRKTVMIWTSHHLLFDGWSMPVLMEELLQNYELLVQGDKVSQQEEDRYEEYIKYLDLQDKTESQRYWEKYMGEVEVGTLLPFITGHTDRNKGVGTYKEVQLTLDKGRMEEIETYCRSQHITVNTLMQGVWACMLHRYTTRDQISYGVTVSGRPEDLSGVEQRVGMYINTIPLNSRYDSGSSPEQWLRELQKTQLESRKHQYTPLHQIQSSLKISGDLFDSIMVFENYPVSKRLSERKWKLRVENVQINEQNNYPLTITIHQSDEINIGFSFNATFIDKERIDRISEHFLGVLDQITKKNLKYLSQVILLSPEEQKQIGSFNQTEATYPKDKTIVELFEQQVKKTPNQTALIYEQKRMSYEELNERSNRLAHYLIRQGVTKDTLIPLCMERGMEMIVAILGILKSGGAYVPIDPQYPQQRIDYMLKDTGSNTFLVNTDTINRLKLKGAIAIDKLDLSKQSSENPKQRSAPDSAAYVIYTSGSTGQPKGVVVEHENVVRLFKTQPSLYDFNSKDVWCMFHYYGFDFSVWEMYGALLFGGKLVVLPKHTTRDSEEFAKLVIDQGVTVLNQTPGSFYVLQESLLKEPKKHKLRYVIFGGEALNPAMVSRWPEECPGTRLINMYGITETTVHVTYKQIGEKEVTRSTSNIGRPIPTLGVYILDPQGNPQPIGVPGELYVSGAGVARGYLNREALTKERFLKDPFSEKKGARMYKTGDLGRWTEEGEIEYLGRLDDQVKIRGYRIELGEIESALEKTGRITASVVLSRKDQTGTNRLVGYVVKKKGSTKENIQKALEKLLPEYMIPQWWVELESIPLTPNGKVDKKALPEVDVEGQRSGSYVKAETPTQEALVKIWEDLLGVEKIGIEDNFFELGGDSILTIQVVSRARKQGYHLEPRDLFTYQTIRGLSEAIGENQKREYTTEQGILSGEVGLLPIQQWYLSQDQPEVSHYNQSVLLRIDKAIGLSQLEAVLEKLVYQHDALSMVFSNKQGKWEQRYGKGRYGVEEEDLRGSDHWQEEWLVKAEPYQRSLDIRKGDLLRCVLVQTPEKEQDNRLLLIVHHLVIDGVSWRIVLEQMEGLLSGRLQDLGSKSSSVRQWYDWLEVYGKTTGAQQELQHWVGVKGGYEGGLITDRKQEGPIEVKDMSYEEVRLSKVQTKQLLQEVSVVYHTEIDDLLLCALAQTLMRWQNRSRITIGLEGHGRQMQGTSVDTTGTVGWFTSLYPVSIEAEEGEDVGGWIKSVKEQLRRVPNKGLGYGIHKYINKAEALQGEDPWEVVFNYLGQLDRVVEGKILKAAGEDTGGSVSGLHRVREKLMLNGLVESGHLKIRWDYSPELIDRKTVEKWSKEYMKVLSEMITHLMDCRLRQEHYNTPSDYGLGPYLNYRQLDTFLSEPYGSGSLGSSIESVYRLSGLQEGMLFHSLYNEHTGAYIEQFRADLYELDKKSFMESWSMLIKRHSILRSGFYHEGLPLAVQVVHREVEMPLEELDYSRYGSKEQQGMLEAYVSADRRKGFDLSSSPLMRLSLLKLSSRKTVMIWTSHHLLFDGWSMPVLMEELLQNYELLVQGDKVSQQEEDRYEEYIKYLDLQDKTESQRYWEKYMGEVEVGTLLPFITGHTDRNKGVGTYKEVQLTLDKGRMEEIETYCRSQHITVNTLMQGVWACMLHRYTTRDQISYGVTVSGRPEDLSGVEQRVGMYINTIPLNSRYDSGSSPEQWLRELQKTQLESRKHQYTPLHQIQSSLKISGDLFDSIMVFENYPVSKRLSERKWKLRVENVSLSENNNYLLSVNISGTDSLDVKFSFNSSLLPEKYVQVIKENFERVLNQFIKSEKATMSEFSLLTNKDKDKLINEFGKRKLTYPSDDTIISLFESQVRKRPESPALQMEDEKLSYSALNQRAEELAIHLLNKGVKPQECVAILMERGLEMIISILAILKVGAIYVPINPDHPEKRILHILDDCNVKTVLVKNPSAIPAKAALENIFNLSSEKKESSDGFGQKDLSSIKIEPQSAAYVIYTSGSTGQPKGVVVEHRNVVSLATGGDFTSFKSTDVLLSTGAPTFDASTIEYWGMLLNGGKLVMSREEDLLNAIRLKSDILKHSVTKMWFTSSWFNQLVETDLELFKPLKTIMVGGERLSPGHISKVRRKYPEIEMINGYGPTENTTFSLTHRILKTEFESDIPIGKVLANREAYILNNKLQLQPIGVPGEIFLGGAGLSRGYLNNPELTKEKFITHPFSNDPEARLYKTGDLGRWTEEGEIEYLGRLDDQVKIRGYRIEPGEIEAVISAGPSVKNSCIKLIEDNQSKKISAYYIPEKSFNLESLKVFVSENLPDYMWPSYWVEMKEFPLNTNGKIDKKMLPVPDENHLLLGDYIEPFTSTEKVLASIWKDVLDLEKIGVKDNFFELGGDSIIVIQVVNKARKAGLEFQVADLFSHETIYELAAYIDSVSEKNNDTDAEQGILSGEVGLLPIQQWYLSQDQPEVSHYNQSVLLRIDKAIGLSQLEAVLEKLVYQHDALSMVFSNKQGKWEQRYGKGRYGVEEEDLRGSDHWQEEWLVKAEPYQRSLDIRKGDLLRCVLVQTPEKEQDNRLLLIVHHLVIDGVSWRIVLEQMEGLLSGRLQDLGSKSSSVRQWYDWLEVYGKTTGAQQELQHWVGVKGGYEGGLITDRKQEGPIEVKDMSYEEVRLSKVQTKQLLQEVSVVYHTEIDDLLLCALAQTLMRWQNRSRITIGLEGHGRQMQGTSVDTTGTVGWFTSLYPVSIEAEEGEDVGGWIKSVKEQLRRVPNKGLGYGIHKYINKAEALQGEDPWEVVFNYLGQLDRVVEGKILKAAGEDKGREISNKNHLNAKLNINAYHSGGQIQFGLLYSNKVFNKSTVKNLLSDLILDLIKIIKEAENQKNKGNSHKSPSDFGLENEISFKELDQFLDEDPDDDIMSF
ncbi:MAG: non-ribosomal peptide synthase/polyketide synthase [Flavobacteriales bacterium]|nr:non-ribosomal peptide synthase/polyketide synthase [Flavobacteriales bacterium]